jgi:hypothetical protein
MKYILYIPSPCIYLIRYSVATIRVYIIKKDLPLNVDFDFEYFRISSF